MAVLVESRGLAAGEPAAGDRLPRREIRETRYRCEVQWRERRIVEEGRLALLAHDWRRKAPEMSNADRRKIGHDRPDEIILSMPVRHQRASVDTARFSRERLQRAEVARGNRPVLLRRWRRVC